MSGKVYTLPKDITFSSLKNNRHYFVKRAYREAKELLSIESSLFRFNTILDSLVANDYANPNAEEDFIASLKTKIEEGQPFSLIRLGDGEGNILFWHYFKDSYPYLSSFNVYRILTMMFGDYAPNINRWDYFASLLADAVDNADYIGIPTVEQTTDRLHQIHTLPRNQLKIRGAVGVISVRTSLLKLPTLNLSQKNLCQWHVHKQLAPSIASLLKLAKKVSVITCYADLLNKLTLTFNLTSGRTILIPPQASNINKTPENIHYPIRFDEIINNDLLNVEEGELFLVSAGLLGKSYCHFIKRRGGMAIDIGSLADVWMGESVRNYHNSAYLDEHKL